MENEKTNLVNDFQDWLKVGDKVIIRVTEFDRWANPQPAIRQTTYRVMTNKEKYLDGSYMLNIGFGAYEWEPIRLYYEMNLPDSQFFPFVTDLMTGETLCHDTGTDDLGNEVNNWYLKK